MDARPAHAAGPSVPAAYMDRASAGAAATGSAKRVHDAALASAAAEQLVKGGKTDLLLRFFDSEFFDEWIAVSYLWRTKAEGVRDYLCNRMYTLDEDRVESYLSQIVALAILRPSPALERLLLDFCSRSVRLACKVSWLICAYTDDERAGNPSSAVSELRTRCLEAALNGNWPVPTTRAAAALLETGTQCQEAPLHESHSAARKAVLQSTLDLARRLCEASANIVKVFPVEDRLASLKQIVAKLSEEARAAAFFPVPDALTASTEPQVESNPCSTCFPMGREAAHILRVVAEETVLLNSREKAPFLLLVEVLVEDRGRLPDAATPATLAVDSPAPSTLGPQLRKGDEFVRLHLAVSESTQAGEYGVRVQLSLCPAVLQRTPMRHLHHRIPSDVGLEDMAASLSRARAAGSDRRSVMSPARTADAAGLAEKWASKVARLRRASPFGHLPRWGLRPVIVKSGDDCRQELMAVQIVSKLQSVFADAGLPLWLRPFEVLITTSHAALIEVITDAPSIHALKSRLPRGSSLRDYFKQQYGRDSQAYRTAQRNFVESMAGYSILSYLFQLKDRHNGNLLLDDDGHIIHIDFSFMLSHSPGGISFEAAPFKLTRELLEVMDSDAEGCASDAFNYFKVLCIQGFLAARKNAEQILMLAEMMQSWNVPCFRGGAKVIQQLRKRFHLGSTEEQCVELVLTLVGDSLDAWCTRQYDYYQRVVNGAWCTML